jgi:hypothetical protein
MLRPLSWPWPSSDKYRSLDGTGTGIVIPEDAPGEFELESAGALDWGYGKSVSDSTTTTGIGELATGWVDSGGGEEESWLGLCSSSDGEFSSVVSLSPFVIDCASDSSSSSTFIASPSPSSSSSSSTMALRLRQYVVAL